MAEIRRVINKYYYPPDLDPTKITKKTQPRCVRMLLPITITCKTCRRNIYEGTKFSAHKETEASRFYFKCPCCSSEISIKTDPQNADYVVEYGAFRNDEPLQH